MKYENLERLNNLREKGAISEEEYQREKEKILNADDNYSSNRSNSPQREILLGLETNTYCMFIHLSQLCGFFVPLAGMAVPIILWIINKDNNYQVDRHGKIVVNWIISSFLYTAAFAILCIILIGIPLIIAFLVANFIFIIIGAMKANSGEYFKYPFSIEFIKIDEKVI